MDKMTGWNLKCNKLSLNIPKNANIWFFISSSMAYASKNNERWWFHMTVLNVHMWEVGSKQINMSYLSTESLGYLFIYLCFFPATFHCFCLCKGTHIHVDTSKVDLLLELPETSPRLTRLKQLNQRNIYWYSYLIISVTKPLNFAFKMFLITMVMN